MDLTRSISDVSMLDKHKPYQISKKYGKSPKSSSLARSKQHDEQGDGFYLPTEAPSERILDPTASPCSLLEFHFFPSKIFTKTLKY